MVSDFVGDKSVPIALVVGLLVGAMGLHEWADLHFVTNVRAEETETQMMSMIQANGEMMRSHLEEYDKNERKKARKDVARQIQRVQDQQYDLEQFERINGANEMTDKRQEDLRRSLLVLQDAKTCMASGHEDCE